MKQQPEYAIATRDGRFLSNWWTGETHELICVARWTKSRRYAREIAKRFNGAVVLVPAGDSWLEAGAYHGPWRN